MRKTFIRRSQSWRLQKIYGEIVITWLSKIYKTLFFTIFKNRTVQRSQQKKEGGGGRGNQHIVKVKCERTRWTVPTLITYLLLY